MLNKEELNSLYNEAEAMRNRANEIEALTKPDRINLRQKAVKKLNEFFDNAIECLVESEIGFDIELEKKINFDDVCYIYLKNKTENNIKSSFAILQFGSYKYLVSDKMNFGKINSKKSYNTRANEYDIDVVTAFQKEYRLHPSFTTSNCDFILTFFAENKDNIECQIKKQIEKMTANIMMENAQKIANLEKIKSDLEKIIN